MPKGRRGSRIDAGELRSAITAEMGEMQIGVGENGWRLFVGILLSAER